MDHFRFERLGRNGIATLVMDGVDCGSTEIPFVMQVISSVGASVGSDVGLPVSERYDHAFAFEGTLHRVDIELLRANRKQATEIAEAQQRSDMNRQ